LTKFPSSKRHDLLLSNQENYRRKFYLKSRAFSGGTAAEISKSCRERFWEHSSFSTLAKWIQKSNPEDMPPSADLDLAKENDRLRKENRLFKEERVI